MPQGQYSLGLLPWEGDFSRGQVICQQCHFGVKASLQVELTVASKLILVLFCVLEYSVWHKVAEEINVIGRKN